MKSVAGRMRTFIRDAKSRIGIMGSNPEGTPLNDWGSKEWNVAAALVSDRSTESKRTRLLWFTEKVARGRGSIELRAAREKQFAPPFSEFAKAFVISWFADRSECTYMSLYNQVAALRSLYHTLPKNYKDPISLTLNCFLQVENELIGKWELPADDPEHLSHATVRSKAETLQTIGTLIDKWRLTKAEIGFRTRIPLQRREIVDRHAQPFEDRKMRLFPEPDVFYFLADLANKSDLDTYWRLRLRAVELQIALGRRVGEVLPLPYRPIVRGEGGAIGVRYFPEKNADPFVAWVPRDKHFDTACQIVERAISDVESICEGARRIAKRLESCTRWEDFPFEFNRAEWREDVVIEGIGLAEMNQWVLDSEISELFTGRRADLMSYFQKNGIPYRVLTVKPMLERLGSCGLPRRMSIEERRIQVLGLLKKWESGKFGRFLTWSHLVWQVGVTKSYLIKDTRVKTAFTRARQALKRRWPKYQPPTRVCAIRLDDIKRHFFEKSREGLQVSVGRLYGTQPLSEMLFVVQQRQFALSRSTHPFLVSVMKTHHIQVFFRGAPSVPSVFEAFGRPDLRAKSHGFRRWVTTEGRRAGINNLVLARWMGRSTLQNDVYDYNEPEVFSAEKLGITLDLSRVFGSVRDLVTDMEERKVSLVEREKFLSAEFKGLIATDKGGCTHEWAITPCQKARACYNNCPEFYVVKGRHDHLQKAIAEKESMERALKLSRAQVGSAYYANGYVQLYEQQLRTVREVIRIHEDKTIADGTLVQVNSGGPNVRAGRKKGSV
jgi:hypothetical protein